MRTATTPVSPGTSHVTDTAEEDKLGIASLKRQLQDIQNKSVDNVAAVWNHVEQENERHINRLKELTDVSLTLKESKPIGLVFFSDLHITSGSTDLKSLREDTEAVADCDGTYVCLVGDYIDNHVKHRAAVVARGMSPTRELELFNYWLGLLQHRVLAMVSGNHDMFSKQLSGLDPLTNLAERHSLYYTPDELNINLSLGSQTYRIMMRHQTRYNSVLNPVHGLFRHLDFCADEPWDIGCAGHHHVSAIAAYRKLGKTRVAVRPGSYQVSTSWSRALGFPSAEPHSPMTIIWPDKRQILPVEDVQQGLPILKSLRS